MTKAKLNEFDRIAPFYDWLAHFVFGKSIRESQTCFLSVIPPDSSVLVLGGGTGFWLPALLKEKPGVRITYVEASARMIGNARKNSSGDDRIIFIHGTEDNVPSQFYDVIVTFFFLDVFGDKRLAKLVEDLAGKINKKSIWLATDFVNERWWHFWMLRVMYIFFGWVGAMENRTLPDWNTAIEAAGFAQIEERVFYKKFIKSCLFGRTLAA